MIELQPYIEHTKTINLKDISNKGLIRCQLFQNWINIYSFYLQVFK